MGGPEVVHVPGRAVVIQRYDVVNTERGAVAGWHLEVDRTTTDPARLVQVPHPRLDLLRAPQPWPAAAPLAASHQSQRPRRLRVFAALRAIMLRSA